MEKLIDDYLDSAGKALFAQLTSPERIQEFLDSLTYAPEYDNRCVLSVLRDRRAHCLDGGLVGAAALQRLGHQPLIVDLIPAPNTDDDHILALYRVNGLWGCVAKSNFVGLRLRAPVYRSVRELVMTFFEPYHNVNGIRTLRAYTRPMNLRSMQRYGWMHRDSGVDRVEKRLLALQRVPLFPPETVKFLHPVDPISFKAGMLITDPDGLYKPLE